MRKRVGSTRGRVLPVWTLACARNGVPAVKIFVQEVQCLRLNRVVVQQPDGYYAAYRPREVEPFLIAKDMDEAFGIVRRDHVNWEDTNA